MAAGCAGPSLSQPGSSFDDNRLTTGSTSMAVAGDQSEGGINCKRLAGRMQIRLLSLRSGVDEATSALSNGLQSIVTSVVGGPAGPGDERLLHNYESLLADNERLKESGCKTYDIEADLANTDVNHTPRPR